MKNTLTQLLFLSLSILISVQGQKILASKTFANEYVVAGQDLEVIVNLFNVDPSTPATNVRCSDRTFDKHLKSSGTKRFDLVSGSFSHEFKSIGPNSNVTYTYTVITYQPHSFNDFPVECEYEREAGNGGAAIMTVSKSSSHLYLRVLGEEEYLAKYADHNRTWFTYAAILSTLLALNFYRSKSLMNQVK